MKRILFLTLLTLFSVSSTVAQCPMCKASVESNMEDGKNNEAGGTMIGGNSDDPTVGMGLNSGILYLMAIPYLMVITIAFFWYKSKKKQERNAASFG